MMVFNVNLKFVVKRRWAVWSFVLIMISSLDYVCESAYCQNWCKNPSSCKVLDVCVMNQATAPVIYIDSSMAPININITCFCLLTHSLSLKDNLFFVQSHSNDKGGKQIEIDDSAFNTTSEMTIFTLSTDTYIKYSQYGETFHSKLCLEISTGSTAERDITINCYTSDTVQALTTSKSIERLSKDPHILNGLSSIGTHTTTFQTTTKSVIQNKQIQIGLVVSVSLPAAFISGVIVAFTIMFLYRWRRRKMTQSTSGPEHVYNNTSMEYSQRVNDTSTYENTESRQGVQLQNVSDQYELPPLDQETLNYINTSSELNCFSGRSNDYTSLDLSNKSEHVYKTF